jgi:hypothetical protein
MPFFLAEGTDLPMSVSLGMRVLTFTFAFALFAFF